MELAERQQKKEEFLDALKKTMGIISSASDIVGISRQSAYVWMREDEDFKKRVEEVTERQKDFVESKLLSRINEDDTTAIIFYLKTRCKERGYTEKIEYEGKQQTEVKLPDINLKVLPDDLLYKMVEAIDDAENNNE